jgi:hypothetical protein
VSNLAIKIRAHPANEDVLRAFEQVVLVAALKNARD